ncbi:MAG TPA: toll/interleukin-1 receptor domain-containing protein [Blastocatellia bacterium]|nr:toll/interleukin-1 receptor domain-containing protein [Blastocatellia bacterium]
MQVRVFVSWSGTRSLRVAERLVEWLPTIVPAARVFYSPDIDGSEEWLPTLLKELRAAQYGIVCVSKQSHRSKWLHFEIGALWRQRARKEIPIFPLLLDITPRELDGPLELLQAKQFNEHVFRELCAQIARRTKLSDKQFQKNFKAVWGQLERELKRELRLVGNSNRRRAA